jgi:hypothetical protein
MSLHVMCTTLPAAPVQVSHVPNRNWSHRLRHGLRRTLVHPVQDMVGKGIQFAEEH